MWPVGAFGDRIRYETRYQRLLREDPDAAERELRARRDQAIRLRERRRKYWQRKFRDAGSWIRAQGRKIISRPAATAAQRRETRMQLVRARIGSLKRRMGRAGIGGAIATAAFTAYYYAQEYVYGRYDERDAQRRFPGSFVMKYNRYRNRAGDYWPAHSRVTGAEISVLDFLAANQEAVNEAYYA